MGLASQARMDKVILKRKEVEEIKKILSTIQLDPEEINKFLQEINSSPITEKQKVDKLLLRPNVGLMELRGQIPRLDKALVPYLNESIEQAEIQIKYNSYIEKEKELVTKMSQLEDLRIPDNFNYEKLSSLSNEAKQKFIKIKPATLGQASRISGVNPSDVQILMVFMGR